MKPGTVVIYKNTVYRCLDRTVIGELDGYVYLRVGDNPRSTESCAKSVFFDVYRLKGGAE